MDKNKTINVGFMDNDIVEEGVLTKGGELGLAYSPNSKLSKILHELVIRGKLTEEEFNYIFQACNKYMPMDDRNRAIKNGLVR